MTSDEDQINANHRLQSQPVDQQSPRQQLSNLSIDALGNTHRPLRPQAKRRPLSRREDDRVGDAVNIRDPAVLHDDDLEQVIEILSVDFQNHFHGLIWTRMLRHGIPKRHHGAGRIHGHTQLRLEDTFVPTGKPQTERRRVIPQTAELEQRKPAPVVEHACLARFPGLALHSEQGGSLVLDRVVQ